MKLILHLISLGFCLAVIDTAILTSIRDNLLSYLVSATLNNEEPQSQSNYLRNGPINNKDVEDYDILKQKDTNNEWAKKYKFEAKASPNKPSETALNAQKDQHGEKVKEKLTYMTAFKKGDGVDQVIPETQSNNANKDIGKKYFHMDPVLNSLRRHPNFIHPSHEKNLKYQVQPNFAEKNKFRRADTSGSSSSSSSSSRELKDFKQEFRELWLHKKYEALNKSRVRGDKVNMIAARPWGVPCGDPNQHDMPWGVCMMPAECESEFRIYRGDLLCGRTQFICCGLQLTTYDLYQGFDVSFDDKSLSTDSEEKKDRQKSSKEKKTRNKARERRKRRRERNRRKKKIKRHIKKIIKEIKRILNKQYSNGTKQRKKRTKQLKKFIKDLKKQYRKDRQSVKDLHINDMIHIDKALMDRLKQIEKVNKHFAQNATFREIVLKGVVTKKTARMLLEAYPELDEFLEARRGGGGLAETATRESESREGVLQYDVEYGYLYY